MDAPRPPTRTDPADGRSAARRSVVLVSAVQPYPADSGKKVVLQGLLEYWRDRLGPADVHHVLVGHTGPVPAPYPVQLHRLDGPPTWERLSNLVSRVLLRRHSIQEAMLHGRRLEQQLDAELARIGASLEVYDTIRFAQYASGGTSRTGRRAVYLDDLFSLRYALMLDTMRSHPDVQLDVLGDFSTRVPAVLRRLITVRAVQMAVLALESRLVRRREDAVLRRVETCLLISQKEADLLNRRTGGRAKAIPPAVPGPAAPERRFEGDPVFVFLGLLSLPHNHDGVMTMLRQVMPDLLRRVPRARLRIIGRGASPELVALAAQFSDHVSVEGYVEDLDEVLADACALVMPLRFGSGIKIKVIEALARGLPVVTTPVGAEGLTTGPAQGVVTADVEHFAEAAAALVDPTTNGQVGSAGRRLYDTTYEPSAAARTYDPLILP